MSFSETRPGGNVLKTRNVSGFSLLEAFYPAKTKVSNHSHVEAIMCISLEGMCNERFGSRVRPYAPITLSYLPAGVSHSLEFPHTELRAFSVDIGDHWLHRMREVSLGQDESVHCEGGLLANLFIRLYKEFHNSDGASAIAIEGLAIEMLAEVSRRQGLKSERTPPTWLRRAVELLHSHFSETLTVVFIARTVGVHPVHLARQFRKHYRCTVGEYIRRLRIEHACAELTRSEMSLSDIALAAGFADQSHSGRTFKRFTGMTPAEYRMLTSSR